MSALPATVYRVVDRVFSDAQHCVAARADIGVYFLRSNRPTYNKIKRAKSRWAEENVKDRAGDASVATGTPFAVFLFDILSKTSILYLILPTSRFVWFQVFSPHFQIS